MRRISRRMAIRIGALGLWPLTGCAGMSQNLSQSLSELVTPAPVENPLLVPSGDFETVWNATVKVVDEYFDIAFENRLSRKIVTQPAIGPTLLEPWDGSSSGFGERLESTLQTIRRRGEISVNAAPGGGFLVQVTVFKELEDMVKPDRQAAGRAVFNNDPSVNRTREIVGPFPVPAGWIPRGRDANLENKIVRKLRDALLL
ncbi:MAG: hypothetical protein P4L84_02955 [Isosphaeraceae bacterium]|nr:hypothetical protein [Isosphaeraceae bacterium]